MSLIQFDWVDVPGGAFFMGTEPPRDTRPAADEHPQHALVLPTFEISRCAISNGQYAAFVRATGHPAPGHWSATDSAHFREQHPVTYVDWHDAQAFCAWAGVRLPTEAEWEKTARGTDGRTWPWGETAPTPQLCNCENFVGDTVSVLAGGDGASAYGALGMAGNVWEWTQSAHRPYPYVAADGREDAGPEEPRVVRGGTYNHPMRHVRCADRHAVFASARDIYIGFRVVRDRQAKAPATLNFDWLAIPAGDFLMGNDRPATQGGGAQTSYSLASRHAKNRPADLDNEYPQHTCTLESFRICRTPTTNAQYQQFVESTGYPAPGHWPGGRVPLALLEHPVVYVDWHDANAFCRWAQVQLPSEAQWEKAARGVDGRQWPWGQQLPDLNLANYAKT